MKAGAKLPWKLSLFFLLLLILVLWVSGLGARVKNGNFRWVIISLSVLGSWAIFHFGVSRILIQPLNAIIEGAEKLADGLFNWRIRLNNREDELAELGNLLDRLAETVGERIGKLSQALAETQALLGGMEEGVLILDLHGRVQKMNGAMEAILSHAYPADVGRHYLEVFRDPELNDLIQATLRNKKGQHRSLSPLGQPGRTFHIQSSIVQYPEKGGEGVIVVFHDITELKRLERIRQDFVANVSHELRTPLTTIRGYVEALRDGTLENPTQAEQFLRVIERHTGRMEKIVSDLLLLSEMEAPDRMLHREPLSWSDLIGSALEALRPQAESKNQALQSTIPGELPVILGDSQKVHQVIINLLGNAIAYTQEGGRITVEVRPLERGIEISVADNGIGIPPEHLSRIFERFYRVDKGRSREEGGTGLGLSIVKHIVEAHGGWVRVESKPGRGSRFIFFLPQGIKPIAS
jgi:two-component system phosphate regulon sensor histidine kinase PhoR